MADEKAVSKDAERQRALSFAILLARLVAWAAGGSLLLLAAVIAGIHLVVRSSALDPSAPRPAALLALLVIGVVGGLIGTFAVLFATMVRTPEEVNVDGELVSAGTMDAVSDVADLLTGTTRRQRGSTAFRESDLWRYPLILGAFGIFVWAGVSANDMFDGKTSLAKASEAAREALVPTLILIVLMGLSVLYCWRKLKVLRARQAERG